MGPEHFMIKLDITNGFFHLRLHPTAQDIIGIKCGNQYYKLNRLPHGLSLSPYNMQRTMNAVLKTLLNSIDVKYLVYLDT